MPDLNDLPAKKLLKMFAQVKAIAFKFVRFSTDLLTKT